MKPLTIQQIRQAVGGRALTAQPAPGLSISVICTDTRRMERGSLFVALRGQTYDAHGFIPQAAAAGAIAALVDQVPADPLPNVHLIHVPDTRVALGKLARYVRKQMTSKVIAVAGSNGKTSTKNLIDAALRAKLRGSISPKSFNNDIGVPITIFAADPNQDYLVLEMGTNHHGELRVLSDMGMPDIAVITNCSAEHLEGLDDIAGVRREEASITSGLKPNGLLVVNGDDDELLHAVADYPGRRITFGHKPTNDLFATDVECTDRGVRFRLNGTARRPVFVPLLGRHTAVNALAAIAVARRMGVDERAIVESLAAAHGPEMRLQLENYEGITVLNDAYNANPASMQAAIDTLCALASPGRRVAMLGEMRELGQSTDRFHRELGEFVAGCAIDLLVCVGAKSALIAEAAIAKGMSPRQIVRQPDAAAVVRRLGRLLKPGDTVLLKASRSLRLESVAQAIAQRSQPRRRQSDFFRRAAS